MQVSRKDFSLVLTQKTRTGVLPGGIAALTRPRICVARPGREWYIREVMRILAYLVAGAALAGVSTAQMDTLRDIGVAGAPQAPAVGSAGWDALLAQSGVLLRAQCRVCFRSVQVLDTEHGRVERRRTGWYVLPRVVYKGPVQMGDYLYFEQETERPSAAPLFLSVSHTPEPFCECILQADAAVPFAPGCATLQGVRLMDAAAAPPLQADCNLP